MESRQCLFLTYIAISLTKWYKTCVIKSQKGFCLIKVLKVIQATWNKISKL